MDDLSTFILAANSAGIQLASILMVETLDKWVGHKVGTNLSFGLRSLKNYGPVLCSLTLLYGLDFSNKVPNIAIHFPLFLKMRLEIWVGEFAFS